VSVVREIRTLRSMWRGLETWLDADNSIEDSALVLDPTNTKSEVYHCPGDRDYGHTKQGSYMTEAAAKAEGARPSRGKVCS
jgi:hypothetical protein